MPRKVKTLRKGDTTGEYEAIYPGASQVISFTGTSAQSAALGSPLVQLWATEDCWILDGVNPTAIAGAPCIFVPGGIYVDYLFDEKFKLAVIRSEYSGTLHIVKADTI